MACLRQHLPLRVLHHDTERIRLNLNATVFGRVHIGTVPCVRSLRSTWGLSLACLECLAEHHVLLIIALRLHGRRQHPDAGCPRRNPFHLDFQRRVVLVCSIRKVQHLHPHGPVAVQVKRLSRTHPVALPLHQSLALLGVERHQRISQEIRVRQVIEVRRHIFLHTLQVLHTRIRLNLRRGQTSPTGDRQQ